MIKGYSRAQRVARSIQKEIAIILQQKIRDPRVGMVMVSGVELSQDFSYAKVFVSFVTDNTSEQIKIGIKTLQGAAGFIRILLGKSMYLRAIPMLTFFYDSSIIEGMRFSCILKEVMLNDYLNNNSR